MAKKDVEIYYQQVVDQYKEMVENLKDFEKEASEGLVEPEGLDRIKESIQPIKNNYQCLSYIMYLLNKPTKKKKDTWYNKVSKTLLNEVEAKNTKAGILQQNNDSIKELKKIIKG